jgi:hypothetical protein
VDHRLGAAAAAAKGPRRAAHQRIFWEFSLAHFGFIRSLASDRTGFIRRVGVSRTHWSVAGRDPANARGVTSSLNGMFGRDSDNRMNRA